MLVFGGPDGRSEADAAADPDVGIDIDGDGESHQEDAEDDDDEEDDDDDEEDEDDVLVGEALGVADDVGVGSGSAPAVPANSAQPATSIPGTVNAATARVVLDAM
jgi:hypothetical protein